jgi:hypothetical protein
MRNEQALQNLHLRCQQQGPCASPTGGALRWLSSFATSPHPSLVARGGSTRSRLVSRTKSHQEEDSKKIEEYAILGFLKNVERWACPVSTLRRRPSRRPPLRDADYPRKAQASGAIASSGPVGIRPKLAGDLSIPPLLFRGRVPSSTSVEPLFVHYTRSRLRRWHHESCHLDDAQSTMKHPR